MARITVEDCLDHVDNRFELVLVGTKRARQLMVGNKEPMVDWENDKATVVALREIEEGYVDASILNEQSDEDYFADAMTTDYALQLEATEMLAESSLAAPEPEVLTPAQSLSDDSE